MELRCQTCLRTEHHADGVVTVVDAGGMRTAPEPRIAAEWAVLRAAMTRGEGIVGPCAGCGMPLTATGASGRWTLALPDGAVELGPEGLLVQGKPTDPASVGARVEAAMPRDSLGLRVYQGAMFTWIIVPMILWVCAFFCFATFLCIGVPQGAEFMPR